MEQFDRQFRGYNRLEVDDYINELKQQIQEQTETIQSLQSDIDQLNEQNTLLTKELNVHEKTNEEIARLALKEASELIEKAKRNATVSYTHLDVYKRQVLNKICFISVSIVLMI